MIPAGIRPDLFHSAALLPNEIRIPTKNMLDSEECNSRVNAGPSEQLKHRPSKLQVALEAHVLWIRWTEKIISSVKRFCRGRPQRIKLTNVSNRTVYFPAQNNIAVLVPAGDLPRGDGCVRLDSMKYQDWQGLAYEGCRDPDMFQRECELYAQFLVGYSAAVSGATGLSGSTTNNDEASTRLAERLSRSVNVRRMLGEDHGWA
ncbi:hypothetical protein GQ600_22376 [Phytophthora cactorum]|nr:hypothetical protein GQ600_22376 [Phytophthora cactorum]